MPKQITASEVLQWTKAHGMRLEGEKNPLLQDGLNSQPPGGKRFLEVFDMDPVRQGRFGMIPFTVLDGVTAVGGDALDVALITALLMLRKGQHCVATVPEISKRSAMSERAVREHIRKLEATGLLLVERLPGRQGNQPNRYNVGRELMQRASMAILMGPSAIKPIEDLNQQIPELT